MTKSLPRRGIQIRLQQHPDVVVVAEVRERARGNRSDHTRTARSDVLGHSDAGLSGFDVLARVPHESLPMTVFVTAYDRYALDAFEAQALDYLLKPINDMRFAQALERVRTQWQQRKRAQSTREVDTAAWPLRKEAARSMNNTIREQLEAEVTAPVSSDPAYPRRRGHVRLDVRTIDWIDAAGDYMCVHADGRTHVLRETMKSLRLCWIRWCFNACIALRS